MKNLIPRIGGCKQGGRLLLGASVFVLACGWAGWSQDPQEDAVGKARLAAWEQEMQANEQAIAERMVIKAPQGVAVDCASGAAGVRAGDS